VRAFEGCGLFADARRSSGAPEAGTLVIGVMPGFVDTDMVKHVTAPKITPQLVAQSVVDALRDGTEDVYPGPAKDIATALQHDPNAVEKQFAAQFSEPIRGLSCPQT
jgi:hypothetical protein